MPKQRKSKRGRRIKRKLHTKETQKTADVAAPADGDSCRSESVFKDECPTDDPSHNLAHGRIAVGICAAGNRNHRSKLRVTQAREDTAYAGDYEGKHNGRPGELRRGDTCQRENARANNRANAEGDQVYRPERAL